MYAGIYISIFSHVCGYIYIYIYICVCAYSFLYTHTHTYTYIHIHICTHTQYSHVFTHTHIYIYIYISLHTHIYIYIYMYIYIHIYIYIYIFIYIRTHAPHTVVLSLRPSNVCTSKQNSAYWNSAYSVSFTAMAVLFTLKTCCFKVVSALRPAMQWHICHIARIEIWLCCSI